MAIPHPLTQTSVRDVSVAGAAQAGAQMGLFWRAKVTRALDGFEGEARRMLGLEAQLSVFAEQYKTVLGAALVTLHGMDEALAEQSGHGMLAGVEVHQQRCTARQDELKTRYRSLAMEIHPDRAQLVESTGDSAQMMQQLTAAYRAGDLAALLKLEAQLYLTRGAGQDYANIAALESALRDIARAGDTYAQGYRELLNSPLNELMLKTLSAQREGWDWMEATHRKLARSIDEKEQQLMALMAASGIGAVREASTTVA